ncbi:PH domain-containing protein [Flavobacterium sp. SM15]|uniref:PH domain-containing protein n=1 Tax=Flavobacterium sp. SM15 TaxID=2908005 RepID=UPI001EDA257A|nr:PH domain-containing protein [Flavobacterium sp. SM15]MCG2612492.1 PH domain-containing protein [Flavobacterium sp. SM15]
MQNFTNEILNTNELPKFEEVTFEPLHQDYWKIVLIQKCIFLLILSAIAGGFLFFNEEIRAFWHFLVITIVLIFGLSVLFGRISFRKRGYAFRQHDLLYKSGIISESTTIIPYNRIQHVALHEGFISRLFGLAEIEVFTAGGGNSDIQIPGIEKEKAQNIKQLLMQKLTEEPSKTSSENEY